MIAEQNVSDVLLLSGRKIYSSSENVSPNELVPLLEKRTGVRRELFRLIPTTGHFMFVVDTEQHSILDYISLCFLWDFADNPLHGLWVSDCWACQIANDLQTGRLAYTEPWELSGTMARTNRRHGLLFPLGELSDGVFWWGANIRRCLWDCCTCMGPSWNSEDTPPVLAELRIATANDGLKLRVEILDHDCVRQSVICDRAN